jgi:drug/metabolite transporter (DMT)-like permease
MTSENRFVPVLALCLGIFVFTQQDLVVKLLAGAYPVHELIVLRCLVGLPLLLPVIHRAGGLRRILSPRAGWLALRGVSMLVAYTAYYLAFPLMKLADVLALFAIVPIVLAAMARIFLGERISPRGWFAVLIGFAGALVMVRPGVGVFKPASLLPLLAALAYATAQLQARRLGTRDSAAVMAFYQMVIFFLAALGYTLAQVSGAIASGGGRPEFAFLTRGWVYAPWRDMALMGLCGVVAALGSTLLSQAYRSTRETNLVAAFEYTALLWAALFGYLFWNEVPAPASFAGAALIVGGGLVLLTGRRPAAPALAAAQAGSAG